MKRVPKVSVAPGKHGPCRVWNAILRRFVRVTKPMDVDHTKHVQRLLDDGDLVLAPQQLPLGEEG